MKFEATNHLRAEADEAWIALVMGGHFHNSNRCDLPTRTLRAYFAPFDSYELRDGVTDTGHNVNLAGFNGSRYREPQGWNRFTNAYCIGFQIRDLQSFVWRAEYRNRRFEIRAQRINNNRWAIEYCSDCENSEHELEMVEYGSLLKDWFQMIDPDTLEIIKAGTIVSLASAAGEAAQIVDSRTNRGYHPQMFEQFKALASEHDVDVSRCWGAHSVWGGESVRAELALWWKMMLELPREEDQPTFREGFDTEHAWKLRHVNILFARYGNQLPTYIRHGSNTVPQDQLVEELVVIGRAVHQVLAHPPSFSFHPYLFGYLEKDVQQMLHQVSEQLGWSMV